MSLVSTDNFVLTSLNVDANAPFIGYDNHVTERTLSSSESANPNFPLTRLANDATNLFWKSSNNNLQYIDVSDIDFEIDYVGIAYHNFGSGGFRFWLEGSWDGGDTYFTLVSEARKANDRAILFRFEVQYLTNVRIWIDPEDGPVPYASVLFAGRSLLLPRNIYVGYSPIIMARQSKTNNAKSESGHFLGRLTTGRSSQSGFTMNNIEAFWMRQYMLPFLSYAEDSAFFFAWRPGRYPFEVGYCWLIDDPLPRNDQPNGMMSITLNMGGLVP